jgi:hypothetical protein
MQLGSSPEPGSSDEWGARDINLRTGGKRTHPSGEKVRSLYWGTIFSSTD